MNKRENLTEYPNLMSQWDYERNTLDPTQVTAGSDKTAWWVCGKGHSWATGIRNRCRGVGCPYCAGKRVLTGFNDLQTLRPELVREWDFDKNDLLPSQVTIGSKAAVWWICEKEHSWNTVVYSRTSGRGCPICAGTQTLPGFNDLQTLNPELAQEWDYDKNDLLPSQVAPHSHQYAWWRCTKRHSWKSTISNRNIWGCPYCSGKAVLFGFNDLQTQNPKLAAEWDLDKNELMPSEVTAMSNKSVWWICAKGHSWEAYIYSRSVGSGCPYCAGKRVLAGFNDLLTLNPKLAREWDYDKNTLTPAQVTPGSAKTAWWKCAEGHSWERKIVYRTHGSDCPFCRKGYWRPPTNIQKPLKSELIREWDCEKNELTPSQVTSGSNEKIWWKCAKGHSWQAQIVKRTRGSKCPYCIGRSALAGFNDLQTLKPELAEEWDYDKNEFTPLQIMPGSNKKVWWKCEKGHSWQCPVHQRSYSGYGCPYCSGQRVLKGFNDLMTRNPDLANQWDYDKNELTPTQVTPGSPKKAWWKCEKGHSWCATIGSRKAGKGCPYCAGRLVLPGFNDLRTLRPALAQEWDNEKNALSPSHFTLASGIAVWWKCSRGHSWKTKILNRSVNGTDCPYCSGAFPYSPKCVK